jgi:ferredoxin
MTPFGIRKKLKSLLGGSPRPPVPELPRYPVVFEMPNGKSYTVDAKEGDSLVLASGRSAEPIATGCADGTCATCRVEVLEGAASLSPEEGHETGTKRAEGVADNMRLGCQVAVLGPGVKVRIVNVLGEELVE